jgi:hypothetical protein
VLSALVTLFASTVTLTLPTAGASDCPSPRQLAEALNALAPGLVATAPAPATTGASSLRLSVTMLTEGDLRVELSDAKGETLLHRVLPAAPRGHETDCPALAETVALIVERYLHDVGYEAPPLAPPPKASPPTPAPPSPVAPPPVITTAPPAPPTPATRPSRAVWRVGVAASGRLGDVGGFDGDAALALGVEGGGEGPRLGVRLGAGFAAPAQAQWTDHMAGQPSQQAATLRRLPLRLGGYVRLPAGPGQLEPGIGAGADLLLVSTSGPVGTTSRHLAPFGDVAVGYSLFLLRPLYVRILSRVALSLPYDFNILDGTPVWRTPRAYAELGVELGFAFP